MHLISGSQPHKIPAILAIFIIIVNNKNGVYICVTCYFIKRDLFYFILPGQNEYKVIPETVIIS